MKRAAVSVVLLPLQIASALMVLYLDVLSVAALLWRRSPPPAREQNCFAVLVPAHNEQELLPPLLSSLAAIEYPTDRFDVHVVADNCNDATAEVASAAGAAAHVRRDEQNLGKGYALRWLLSRLHEIGTVYDAYVIFDADSVVAPNFLAVMNRYLARGDRVIQSYYGVLNPGDTWPSALRYAALALYNDLRPRGRDFLHLSAGLRGNGMCFRADVLQRFGWEAFTLAEDVELHLTLVGAGVRVGYAPETSVLAEMPTSLGQAQTQNVRWERGRLQMLRAFGPRLVLQGLRRSDPTLLDAVAEQVVPPLSVLTAVSTILVLAATVLRLPGPRRLGSFVLLGQIGYVGTGLRLVHAPARIYLSLLRAPLYIAWKVWIYAMAAARLSDNRWIRTSRRPAKGR